MTTYSSLNNVTKQLKQETNIINGKHLPFVTHNIMIVFIFQDQSKTCHVVAAPRVNTLITKVTVPIVQ